MPCPALHSVAKQLKAVVINSPSTSLTAVWRCSREGAGCRAINFLAPGSKARLGISNTATTEGINIQNASLTAVWRCSREEARMQGLLRQGDIGRVVCARHHIHWESSGQLGHHHVHVPEVQQGGRRVGRRWDSDRGPGVDRRWTCQCIGRARDAAYARGCLPIHWKSISPCRTLL